MDHNQALEGSVEQNLWQRIDNNVTLLNKLTNVVDSLSFGIDCHRSYIDFVQTVKNWANHFRLVEKKYDEISYKLNKVEELYKESQSREAMQTERISSLQTEIENKENENDFLKKKIKIIQEQLYSDASVSIESEDENLVTKNIKKPSNDSKRTANFYEKNYDDPFSLKSNILKRNKFDASVSEDEKKPNQIFDKKSSGINTIKDDSNEIKRKKFSNEPNVIITRRSSHSPNMHNPCLRVSTPKLNDSSQKLHEQCLSDNHAYQVKHGEQLYMNQVPHLSENLNILNNDNQNMPYLNEEKHEVSHCTMSSNTPRKIQDQLANVDIMRYFPMTHHFKNTTSTINYHCVACDKKIGFRKQVKQCMCCNSICHAECFMSLPNPCFELSSGSNYSKTKSKSKDLVNFCPQHAPQVPGILVHLIIEIEKRGMNFIGLYTINGSSKSVNTLIDRFFQTNIIPNFSIISDVGILTDCFKKFLVMIDDALIPQPLWTKFCRASIKNDPNELSKYVRQMKQPNRDTLALIMIHFQRICNNSIHNRVNAKIIARCFADIIARYDDESETSAVHYFNKSENQITIVEALIRLPSCVYIQILEYDTTKILKDLP